MLASPRGFCAGVVRAIEIVERTLDSQGAPVYVRKQIVHNIHVVRDLETRGAIFDLVQAFRAKVVDVADDAMTLEVVGDPGKLVALEQLLEAYGILEIARTGKVALERASGVNTELLKASVLDKRVPA
jgi:acetolactate synthase-1/3 small subunit